MLDITNHKYLIHAVYTKEVPQNIKVFALQRLAAAAAAAVEA